MMKIINRHEEDENEVWFDYKEHNVRFPEHKEDMNGKVITYNVEELNKLS